MLKLLVLPLSVTLPYICIDVGPACPLLAVTVGAIPIPLVESTTTAWPGQLTLNHQAVPLNGADTVATILPADAFLLNEIAPLPPSCLFVPVLG